MSGRRNSIPVWRKGPGLGWPGMLVLLALAPVITQAQPGLPPGAVDQFQRTLGSRIEAVIILGGDYGAASGLYHFRDGERGDLDITKLGGGGIVAKPRPMGDGHLKWAPVLVGNVGSAKTDNQFSAGYLQGNEMVNRLLAVEVGGGARFYLTNHFSVTPTLSGIYGRVQNEFKALNSVGDSVKAAASGTYVDWTVKTWSAVPALDLDYEFEMGRTLVEFESRLSYFHTGSLSSTSALVDVAGNSQSWENRIDVDVPLGWVMFGREVHTGGAFGRTELGGGAIAGLNSNYMYTVNGRLVLDMKDKIWPVRWIGLGATHLWGDHFSGWSAGIDLRLEF